MNQIIHKLYKKFNIKKFFVRIFIYNKYIYIWNDKTIYIKLDEIEIKKLMKKIDIFIDKTIKLFKDAIEKKYDNMKSRKLSVIIPNYNNEKTIKNTIDSILNSSYNDIEIIFIDDCSTDNSLNIVYDNFEKNPNVFIYKNNKNNGAYYCRNKGILLSTGYYIANVDGDDTVSSEKFKYEINNLENKNKDKFNYWSYGTNIVRYYYDNDHENIFLKKKIKNNVLFTSYRKLFNYIGYYFDNRYSSDSDLYIVRSKIYGLNHYIDRTKCFYYALFKVNKNLTSLYDLNDRIRYHENMKYIYHFNYQIKMAFFNDNEFLLTCIHT